MQEPVQEAVLRRGFTEQGYPVPAAVTVGTCESQGSKKQPCIPHRGIINVIIHQGAAGTGSFLPPEVLLLFPRVRAPTLSLGVGDPTQLPLLGEEAGAAWMVMDMLREIWHCGACVGTTPGIWMSFGRKVIVLCTCNYPLTSKAVI